MKLPPLGLCLPCRVVRLIDGDTLEVTVVTGARYRVRLLACWCHETNRGPDRLREKGRAAKAFAQQCLDEARATHLFVPAPDDVELIVGAGGGASPLDLMTFNRVLGHIFVDAETTLSERMCRAGHAWPTKQELEASENPDAPASNREAA